MTEEILRILLADLATVRIKCAQCGVVTEMPIEKLIGAMDRHKHCNHCSQQFDETIRRAFHWLGTAVSELSRDSAKAQATVEFIAPATKRP
jgi:hydrogenase maturation factor HypF (carbamoyltransferase family)